MVCIKCKKPFNAGENDYACSECIEKHLERYGDGGENITAKTRRKSLKRIERSMNKRESQVLIALGVQQLTAQEIADVMFKMGFTADNNRNNASPRLTSLKEQELVEVIGTRVCEKTKRQVSVWQKIEK
ncbi:MAG: hypothetical protein FWG90_01740 [Oscillospiraceae bacterium]|nr:hypothetical protein [Oscillospiraceae bacterium]